MTRVLMSIGSNQNHPEAQVQSALLELERQFYGIRTSKLYVTEPVGPVVQAPFINAALYFETNLAAPDILKIVLDIEARAGRDRTREIHKGPRTLDLDIILFGSEIWESETLVIPHPRYSKRRFVLVPAVEVAPEMRDPVSGRTLSQTLAACQDSNWIKPVEQKVSAG